MHSNPPKNTRFPVVIQRANACLALHSALLICKSKLVLAFGLAALLAVQAAQAQVTIETKQEGVNTKIEVLSGLYALSQGVGQSQGRIVMYRTRESARLEGATSIFVNGQYHTSLIPDGFNFLCLDTGEVEVGARQYRVGGKARDQYDTVTATRLLKGQTQYLLVTEDEGRPVLKPVSVEQASKDLKQSRLQVHTVSRVTQAQDCKVDSVAAPAQAAVMQPQDQYVLMVDVLFAFAKSDMAGLTHQGQATIDEMVSRIQTKYERIDRIHLVGHTDPLGSAAINDRLAKERADTVRQYIERTMKIPGRLTSEGRSFKELVKTGCERVATARAIACNQPNRRVVAEITGVKR
ncbi:hypothetical protein B9Z47_00490 [Limnohabitans sp. 2KL-1]|nr:hypothetical protein B9Z47_00490 [Limnohabitans sp. 2KL-1]